MLLCPACGLAYRAPHDLCVVDGARLVPPEELDPRLGSQIANYKLTEFLGQGGMGVVYRGEHIYLHKQVAIKVLHEKYASQGEAVSRFLQEARAAATIGHPNIVDVSDFGETPDGAAYFIMELVSGRPLDQVLQEDGALPLLRTINILNQVGRALAAAHEKGIVHRDLKPENVMLQPRPGRRDVVRRTAPGTFSVEKEVGYDFVKLLDFGVARMIDAPSDQRRTAAGQIFGTPEYMAPEAARGLPVDHRADVYAFGVLFYEMLTANVPFEGDTAMDVLMAHVNQAPPPPSQRDPRAEVSPAAERLILWCLEKDPQKRPQSMEQALEALKASHGDEVYLRDAENLRGAREAGITPPPKTRKRSVTDDLVDLFKAGDRGGGGVLEKIELESTEPLLLTNIKKADADPAEPAPPQKGKTLTGIQDARGSKFSKKSPKV